MSQAKFQDLEPLTDLQLLDLYIEECRQFVNPRLLGAVSGRGLIKYVDYLPKNIKEAKSVLRSRLSQNEKYWGDTEIDDISGKIENLKRLKKDLDKIKITDVDELIPVLKNMLQTSESVKDYFK
ncbi:hypothetical protein BAS10_04505 [Elizabethkingia meningoseptica]|uniref:hypothetical protein n=1 Tax=Elizabethkingia meningoseptica TaxID=238 RepID=UPI00099A95EA|nr:hypothetical protein [Elizabethkingia meningoseptica]OPB98935.1 hypothetical protein BAS10_04505 [Elizabethkingia meningoseptica]